ncbi:SGNH/GDSL hydrolase family protein [Thiocystis violacea]|uniref:SGNH/GDSL hydrolase family protein n=1 Tax=Thiocystis violacea TaxID=13725 RepID=UPI001904F0E3|nr:SGNH/GDSL hydrolase family protein [Thiocystis violacea]
MRSDDFPERKAEGEIRIMVFGDSVVNGGNLTDHSRLATTLMAAQLSAAANVTVTVRVGNISAGSWWPGNWLAYAREYGFFDADIVVLVISRHDVADNPTFAPLDPNTHPEHQPVPALWELLTRYLPRYLPSLKKVDEGSTVTEVISAESLEQSLADLREFLQLARSQTKSVLVAQYPERKELSTGSLALQDLMG